MRKYFLLITILLFGCNSKSVNISPQKDFETIIIDSCEYLISSQRMFGGNSYSGYGYFSHKGGCKNQIHKCQ